MILPALHARAALLCLLAGILVAGPARAADEIHWTLTGPTSVTFDWRGSETTIRYGLTSAYGLTGAGQTPSPLPFSSSGPFREARLTGLLPGTTYHYSIGTGPDHTFRTMPAAGSTFKVMAFGDVGDTAVYSRVGPVQTLVAQEAPAFVLMLGDLTYGDDSGSSAVDRHFNNVMKWSQDAAYMPSWGNHEWGGGSSDNMKNYKGRFDLPNPQTSPGVPSEECCGEDWYWFDCANIRFIAYPEPFSGAWSDWNTGARALMDAAQANPAIRFIVTFGHRPAYSSGSHSGSSDLAGYMDALGATHSKYVLNLNGHSHNYERSHPRSGVTHVTVGIGGSSLGSVSGSCLYAGGCPAPSWSAFRARHHGALRLTFSPTSIVGEAICGPAGDSGSNRNDITCASGSVFDSFVIGQAPPPPGNAAPAVDAGPAQTVSLASGVLLDGTVSDDGQPDPPGEVSVEWSVTSGPGPVAFLDPDAVDGGASFTVAGDYVLRLAASDGTLTTTDDVQIEVQSGPPTGVTVERRVATGTDDAEESATGTLYIDSTDLELVFDFSDQWVGMRFTGLDIPRGAVIGRAWLQFEVDEIQSEATSLTIQGEASNDAATFSSASRVSSRPRTAAAVGWTPPPWNTVGQAGSAQRTPELANVIQEIVDRPGWEAGNAIVLLVHGSGHRTASAYEGRPAGAALLHVETESAVPPVGVEPPGGDRPALALGLVWPNPARGEIGVDYSLAGPAPASLELLDIAGRVVHRRELDARGPGRFRAHLAVKRDVTPGIYWVRLSQTGRGVTRRVAFVR